MTFVQVNDIAVPTTVTIDSSHVHPVLSEDESLRVARSRSSATATGSLASDPWATTTANLIVSTTRATSASVMTRRVDHFNEPS